MSDIVSEKIAKINKQPCNLQEVAQSITNITNVLNIIGNGSLWGACQLTSDGSECAPEDLDVSNFVPYVLDFSVHELPIPTTAKNYINRPYKPLTPEFGYIIYNFDSGVWEAVAAHLYHKDVVTSVEILPRGFRFNFEKVGVPICDETSTIDHEFPTVLTTALQSVFKEDCSVYYTEVQLEVWDSVEPTGSSLAWEYDAELDVLIDIGMDEYSGDIYGLYATIRVPCIVDFFSALLIETTDCASGSGGI